MEEDELKPETKHASNRKWQRKVQIRTYLFSKWLVIPQPYAVHSVSAYIPCWSRFSLNTKRVCFPNAFEAHSATACANVRQEEKLPIAQVPACSTGGYSNQGGSCRDLSHPTCRNVCIYRLHLHCQGILHGGWKSYSNSKPAAAAKSLQSCLTLSDPMDCSLPGSSIHGSFQARVLEWVATAFSKFQTYPSWNGYAAAVPHNDPFKLAPWSQPLPQLSADCMAHPWSQDSHSSRISLGRRNRDAEKERVPFPASNTLSAFLFPLQGKYPSFLSLFNSHTRIIYWKVVRLQK